MKSNFKKWFTFFILVLGGGTIYKLPWLKSVFYVQMQEFMGLTHTQIGTIMSVNGLVTTFGFGAAIYFTDKVSKKKSLPLSMILTGLIGIYIGVVFPGYTQLLVAWILFGLTCDMMYWPVLLKSVKSLGGPEEQGTLFGFLETGRGVVDTVVVSIGLFIFTYLGSNAFSFKMSIVFFGAILVVIGVISYFCLEDDKVANNSENKKEKLDYKAALKMPAIWVAAFNVFAVYSVYCGLTYFMPFLSDIYHLPLALVSIYGIINAYGLKIIGGPLGGLIADKKLKSSSRYLKYSFALVAIVLGSFLFLPHQSMNVYVGMAITLFVGAIIFSQRAIFFAPVGELGIPEEISGSAMAMASFIGYAPGMFAYALYGAILDHFKGIVGYKIVFAVMIAFAVIGFFLSSYLVKIIENKKAEARG